MLSHELRTPLNPVFVTLHALEDDESFSRSHKEDLRLIRRNLELEARLIDDLLDLTRIVKGKLSLQSERQNVHDIIVHVCEICSGEAAKRGLDLSLSLAAENSLIMGDATRLLQVFWNLVNNAIKFTAPGGKIVIGTANIRPEHDEIIISVSDTGRGIDSVTLPKIFQPFEQGPMGLGQSRGLGLGLAISRSIVDAHGGSISAASDGLELGSRFEVRLKTVKEPHLSEAGRRAGDSSQKRFRHLKILLVDDHDDTLNSLSRLLQRRGHNVTTAATFAQAISAAEDQRFDLLLSDLGLPDHSGFELMTALKPKVTVGIALSGFGMDADIDRSLAAGFSDHLTKPINFETLEQSIMKLMAD